MDKKPEKEKSKLSERLKKIAKEQLYDYITKSLKWLLFITLIIIEIIVICSTNPYWWVALILSLCLTLLFSIESFVQLPLKGRIPFDVFNFLIVVGLTIINGESYTATLFNIILSAFYLENKLLTNSIMALCSFICYCGGIVASAYINNPPQSTNIEGILSGAFTNDLIFFALIFLFVNLVNESLRKNKELTLAVKEIRERERKLKEANEQIRGVTVLKERNRIAKQIHDTTGHSITTIIMQTEAAKLLIDKDPKEAKNRIISANLQAVTALEEMRKAVRVLSGETGGFDLYGSLTGAINETTEGTGIVIRSKIDPDIKLDNERGMFIYSSLKEGLNNGIRHGSGTAFLFELSKRPDGVFFLLSDNGKGTNEIKPSFGLKKMQEEAKALGGEATFDSAEDEGFEIRIYIPIEGEKR